MRGIHKRALRAGSLLLSSAPLASSVLTPSVVLAGTTPPSPPDTDPVIDGNPKLVGMRLRSSLREEAVGSRASLAVAGGLLATCCVLFFGVTGCAEKASDRREPSFEQRTSRGDATPAVPTGVQVALRDMGVSGLDGSYLGEAFWVYPAPSLRLASGDWLSGVSSRHRWQTIPVKSRRGRVIAEYDWRETARVKYSNVTTGSIQHDAYVAARRSLRESLGEDTKIFARDGYGWMVVLGRDGDRQAAVFRYVDKGCRSDFGKAYEADIVQGRVYEGREAEKRLAHVWSVQVVRREER